MSIVMSFFDHNLQMDKPVTFPKESDEFYTTLKLRVRQYFDSNQISLYANTRFALKAVLLLAIHIGLYTVLLFSANPNLAIACMVLMGPLSILIGINIAHDAAHGSISNSPLINSICLRLLDVMGANSYMWKNRHVFSHHIYPNILDNDADLKQNPMVRIFPDDERHGYHRFQFLYAPILYLFYTMNWLLFRDFKDFTAKRIGSFQPSAHSKKEWIRLFAFKLVYFSYIIAIPLIFSNLSFAQILLGYVLMNFAASILITLALIPSHVAEDSAFPTPNDKGVMPHSWAHHQVLTVIDFATDNNMLNFFFGGFNHHVTHHLFPKICHTHYTKLTPIIRQTAEEFGIAYKHESSLLNAYISHFKLLRNNGKSVVITNPST